MVAIDCGCGHHMEATDADQLFTSVRKHVDQVHSNLRLTDQAIREMIRSKSYSADTQAS